MIFQQCKIGKELRYRTGLGVRMIDYIIKGKLEEPSYLYGTTKHTVKIEIFKTVDEFHAFLKHEVDC